MSSDRICAPVCFKISACPTQPGITSAGAEASYGNYKTAGALAILSVLPVVAPLRAMTREGVVVAEIKVPSPPTATIMQHPGDPAHFSILLSQGQHSHQVVTSASTTRIVSNEVAGAGTVLRSIAIEVNTGSTTVQSRLLSQGNLDPYNKITNSCVTHVCDVLKAGGVDVPEANGSAQFRYVLKLLNQ